MNLMFNQLSDPTRLEIRCRYNVPRERVFRAWTEPDLLKQWFRAGPGYSTPIAEVDLRIGGRFRIGLQPSNSDQLSIATGVYRQIRPPEKLVFTWSWEYEPAVETLVTLEFIAVGDQTELVLTHENFSTPEIRNKHTQGWTACLENLKQSLEDQR
jgi:uncharacterized protein YndB with AHSA1/START domain